MNTETGRILVVDDDPTVADVVGALPASATATTVECVARRVTRPCAGRRDAPPTWSCSTSCCPGIDGLEVCRRLRERWPIPVVMLTALGEETDRLVGLETGRRRLRHQAVQPARAGAPGEVGAAAVTRRGLPDVASGAIADGDLLVDLSAHEVASARKLIR